MHICIYEYSYIYFILLFMSFSNESTDIYTHYTHTYTHCISGLCVRLKKNKATRLASNGKSEVFNNIHTHTNTFHISYTYMSNR